MRRRIECVVCAIRGEERVTCQEEEWARIKGRVLGKGRARVP